MAIIAPKEQVVAIYNAANPTLPTPLTLGDVDFGAALPYGGSGGDDTRNTELTITAKAGSAHFTGSKVLHYTRAQYLQDIVDVNGSIAVWNTDEGATAEFNKLLQNQYPNDAFENGQLTFDRTDGGEGRLSITVSFPQDDYKFIGGSSNFNIIDAKSDLATADGELDGFNQ